MPCSFANTIFTAHEHPQLGTHLPGLVVNEESNTGNASIPSLSNTGPEPFPVTSAGTGNFSNQTVVLTVEAQGAQTSTHSIKRFSRYPIKPTQSLHPITVIDTPGLPEPNGSERDLAVRGLERLIESGMAEKLRQERSIRRLTRKGGLENDGLIHLGEPESCFDREPPSSS
jgi:hypothetical protein